MCIDPGTLAVVATIASTAVSAYSYVKQGQAASAAAEYEAQIAERNAKQAENEKVLTSEAAAIERRRLGQRVAAERGQRIANASAMGLDPGFGSVADIDADLHQAYRIDRSIVGKNEIADLQRLDLEQADYRDGATLSRARGKSAKSAGNLAALGAVLGGAADVSASWIEQHPSIPSNSPAKRIPVSPGY